MVSEKLKKYGVPIAAILGSIAVIYFAYKQYAANQAALANAPNPNDYAAQQQALQDALSGAGGNAGTTAQPVLGDPYGTSTGGTSAVTQPGTSASGVPSNSQSVQGYISPAPLSVPSAAASLNSFGNPSAGLTETDPNNPAPLLAQLAASNPSSAVFAPTTQGGSTGSYLNSSGYLNSQAQSEMAECQADPTGPGCQVTMLTDPNFTGGVTVAGASLEASNICEQSQANLGLFGQTLIGASSQCNGTNPSTGLVSALLNQFGGAGTPATSTTPSTTPTSTSTSTSSTGVAFQPANISTTRRGASITPALPTTSNPPAVQGPPVTVSRTPVITPTNGTPRTLTTVPPSGNVTNPLVMRRNPIST